MQSVSAYVIFMSHHFTFLYKLLKLTCVELSVYYVALLVSTQSNQNNGELCAGVQSIEHHLSYCMTTDCLFLLGHVLQLDSVFYDAS